MKKIVIASFVVMGLFLSQYSLAGQPLTPLTMFIDSKAVTKMYVGLKGTLGSDIKPELIIGQRKTNVDFQPIQKGFYSGNDVLWSDDITIDGVGGNDISLSIDLETMKLGSIRAKRFNGGVSLQNELSVGWDVSRGVFVGAGFGARHLSIGADYFIDSADAKSALSPYVIINSLEKTSLKDGENFTGYCNSRSEFNLVAWVSDDPDVPDYFCASGLLLPAIDLISH